MKKLLKNNSNEKLQINIRLIINKKNYTKEINKANNDNYNS